MKKNTSLLRTLLALALAMCLALTACGKKAPATTNEPAVSDAPAATNEPAASDAEQAPTTPEAVLEPEKMEWGYNEAGSDDTQHWYVNGDKTQTAYIFFEDGYLNTVDGAQCESLHTKNLDGHIVDLDTGGDKFDFVFTDVFTCYDLVSGLCYMRSDLAAATASLTAATFYCEAGDNWNVSFSQDGTMCYDNDGDLCSGTWCFEDARTIRYTLDSDPDSHPWFEINYNADTWQIASIRDTDVYYPAS